MEELYAQVVILFYVHWDVFLGLVHDTVLGRHVAVKPHVDVQRHRLLRIPQDHFNHLPRDEKQLLLFALIRPIPTALLPKVDNIELLVLNKNVPFQRLLVG
jgi:hypothetical protein